MIRTASLVVGLFAVVSVRAAGDGADIKEVAAFSKVAGICGAFQQMKAFQRSTNIQNGDEFVGRFLNSEYARLGKSEQQFVELCEFATAKYSAYLKAIEQGAK